MSAEDRIVLAMNRKGSAAQWQLQLATAKLEAEAGQSPAVHLMVGSAKALLTKAKAALSLDDDAAADGLQREAASLMARALLLK